MPIYAMQCGECSRTEDIYRSVKGMNDDLPECCGNPMHRRIVAPFVATDIQPYKSMVTGEMINSRSQHRSHLKQHGLIEVGNETKHLKPKPVTPPPGLKQKLIEVVNQTTRS